MIVGNAFLLVDVYGTKEDLVSQTHSRKRDHSQLSMGNVKVELHEEEDHLIGMTNKTCTLLTQSHLKRFSSES